MRGKYFHDNWYVSEQTNFLTKMCDPTNKKPGLERITEKEKEEKVRKQGCTMTIPTTEKVNFVLQFETFDMPPYGRVKLQF